MFLAHKNIMINAQDIRRLLFIMMQSANQIFQPEQEDSDLNTIRVNSDNSNKKLVVVFWSFFAILLIIVFITSNFTPSTFIFKTNHGELYDTQHKDCQNPVNFENGLLVCQQFNALNPRLGLIMKNLSPLNQFAQINLIIVPTSKDLQTLQIKQTISVELMSLKRKHFTTNNQDFTGFQKGEDVRAISNIEFDTKTYSIQPVVTDEARVESGYQINLGYYRQFRTQDALLVVSFVNVDWSLFQNCTPMLTAILMNDGYTKFIMAMRGAFLGMMTLSAAFFLHRLRFRNRSLLMSEQSIVVNLSVSIILFNDPYYFIGVFKPNIFSVFIETLFLALFFMMLLSCWIYMLQKINAESRGEEYRIEGWNKWLKILAAIDCFIIIFVFNYEIGYYAFHDSPIVPAHKIFSNLFIITGIFFGLIFGYVAYLYLRMFQAWSNIIWRHKLYAIFNIFFVLLILIFMSLGWFSLYDQSSQKFEILYASMNIYVLYMQFMYMRPFGAQPSNKLHEEFREVELMSTVENEAPQIDEAVIDLDCQDSKQIRYNQQRILKE